MSRASPAPSSLCSRNRRWPCCASRRNRARDLGRPRQRGTNRCVFWGAGSARSSVRQRQAELTTPGLASAAELTPRLWGSGRGPPGASWPCLLLSGRGCQGEAVKPGHPISGHPAAAAFRFPGSKRPVRSRVNTAEGSGRLPSLPKVSFLGIFLKLVASPGSIWGLWGWFLSGP